MKDAENQDEIDSMTEQANRADGLKLSGADLKEGPTEDRHIDERPAKDARLVVSGHPRP